MDEIEIQCMMKDPFKKLKQRFHPKGNILINALLYKFINIIISWCVQHANPPNNIANQTPAGLTAESVAWALARLRKESLYVWKQIFTDLCVLQWNAWCGLPDDDFATAPRECRTLTMSGRSLNIRECCETRNPIRHVRTNRLHLTILCRHASSK